MHHTIALSRPIIGSFVKRAVGDLFKTDLQPDQIELDKTLSKIRLKNLDLDEDYINDILAQANVPCTLVAGHVGSALADIPWLSLLDPKSNIKLEIEDLNLILIYKDPKSLGYPFKPGSPRDGPSGSLITSVYDFDFSSFGNQELPEVDPHTPLSTEKGLAMLGQLVSKLIFKLEFGVKHLQAQILFEYADAEDHMKTFALVAKLDAVQSRDVESDASVEEAKLKPDVLRKYISFRNLVVYIAELNLEGKNLRRSFSEIKSYNEWAYIISKADTRQVLLQSGVAEDRIYVNILMKQDIKDIPKIEITGEFSSARAAFSPTQLDILLKIFSYQENSMYKAQDNNLGQKESQQENSRDEEFLGQSLMPEDQAFLANIVNKLEQQEYEDMAKSTYYDAEEMSDTESIDDDGFVSAEEDNIELRNSQRPDSNKMNVRANITFHDCSLTIMYDGTKDTRAAFDVQYNLPPEIKKVEKMEEEDNDIDEDNDENEKDQNWLGIEPAPSHDGHHAIFQINGTKLTFDQMGQRFSASILCESLCGLEYLRFIDNGQKENMNDEKMKGRVTFGPSIVQRPKDGALYIKNHLVQFRSPSEIRQHLQATLVLEPAAPNSKLYNRDVQINIPEVFVELDPLIMERLTEFVKVFGEFALNNAPQPGNNAQFGSVKEKEEIMSLQEVSNEEEKTIALTRINLSANFFMFKLLFPEDRKEGEVKLQTRPEAVLLQFYNPKVTTEIIDDQFHIVKWLVEFNEMKALLVRESEQLAKTFFQANLYDSNGLKTTPLEITIGRNDLKSLNSSKFSNSAEIRGKAASSLNDSKYEVVFSPFTAIDDHPVGSPSSPFFYPTMKVFEDKKYQLEEAGHEDYMDFIHQAKESSRFRVSLVFPSCNIKLEKCDFDLLLDLTAGFSRTFSKVQQKTVRDGEKLKQSIEQLNDDSSSLFSLDIILDEGCITFCEDQIDEKKNSNPHALLLSPHTIDFEFKKVEIFQVLKYWGQDTSVLRIEAQDLTIKDSAKDFGPAIVFKKAPYANTQLSVIVETQTNSTTANIKAQGVEICHSPGYHWALRLAEFLTPPASSPGQSVPIDADSMSLSASSSSNIRTLQCNLQLQDIQLRYVPIGLPSRLVLQLSKLELEVPLCSLSESVNANLSLHNCLLWLIDDVSFANHDYWKALRSGSQLDQTKHWERCGYANVGIMKYLKLQVNAMKGNRLAEKPLLETLFTSDSLDLHICRDSAYCLKLLFEEWIEAETSAAIVLAGQQQIVKEAKKEEMKPEEKVQEPPLPQEVVQEEKQLPAIKNEAIQIPELRNLADLLPEEELGVPLVPPHMVSSIDSFEIEDIPANEETEEQKITKAIPSFGDKRPLKESIDDSELNDWFHVGDDKPKEPVWHVDPDAWKKKMFDSFLNIEEDYGEPVAQAGENEPKEEIVIKKNYTNVWSHTMISLPVDRGYPPSFLRLLLHDLDLNLVLHDGFDFRKEDGKSKSARSNDCMKINVSKLNTQFDLFSVPDDQPQKDGEKPKCNFRVALTIKDVNIFDHLPTSTWLPFMGYDIDIDRSVNSVLIHFVYESLKPTGDSPNNKLNHIRLKLNILPLRFYIDQDAKEYLEDFFSFDPNASPEQMSERPETDPEDNQINNQIESTPTIFITEAVISDLYIKFDYKPKRLRNKTDRSVNFLNVFPIEGAKLEFRSITLNNVYGWAELYHAVKMQWFPRVTQDIALAYMKGVQPLKPLFEVAYGVADLVMLPIKEYNKNGQVVMGLAQGGLSLLKAVGRGTLELSNTVLRGTQFTLEYLESFAVDNPTETIQARRGPADSDVNPNQVISKQASQPRSVSEGVEQAMNSMMREFKSSQKTVLAVPVKCQEAGVSGAVVEVVRAIPLIVLPPVIGLTEGVNRTVVGLQNELNPSRKKAADVKYKPAKK